MFGCSLRPVWVVFAPWGVCGDEQTHVYLAAQHEDGVDVREDAVKAEVDVWTDQGKHRGQDAGSRLELRNKAAPAYFIHTASRLVIPFRKMTLSFAVGASAWVGVQQGPT